MGSRRHFVAPWGNAILAGATRKEVQMLTAPKIPLRCCECGYEIGSYRVPPPCPMCRELCWEPAPWRPFTRRRADAEMESGLHGAVDGNPRGSSR